MQKTVIVRYGELALKSQPVRRRFERSLVSSINLALEGFEYVLRRERGRIFIDTRSPARVTKRLSKVPGIVSVSLATRVKADMDEICMTALKVAKKVLSSGESFAVRTSRVGKHAFSSTDVNVKVGSVILSKVKDVRVDLSNPDREISIEVRGSDAYVFTETVKGIGGLPAGTQGSAVALFSGGVNDAAAAYLMIKRGSRVFPLFPSPHPEGKVPGPVLASAKKLAHLDPKIKLRALPFNRVLDELKKVTPAGYAYCICKRSALKAADAVARRVGAEAIVVADGIKQITAQKLGNLRVMDEACKLPVLRPLVGPSGVEIEQLKAKPAPGSCPFTPPSDIVDLEKIHALEEKIKIGELIEESLSKVRVIRLR
jgi:thiamine biosynthesis protein ThiI